MTNSMLYLPNSLDITLDNGINIYSQYLRKSDTKYIKPKGLPAIEDLEQVYRLKNFRKLQVFGYSITGGKMYFLCDKLQSAHFNLIAKYSDIEDVANSISNQISHKPSFTISENGYKRYKWSLSNGFLYIGTKDKEKIILIQCILEIF